MEPDEDIQRKLRDMHKKLPYEYHCMVPPGLINQGTHDEPKFMYNNKEYVHGKKLQEEIIKAHHEPREFGHMGVTKTLERIRRKYDFPHIKTRVKEALDKCEICARSKTNRHKLLKAIRRYGARLIL